MSTLLEDAQTFQGITVQELVRRSKKEPALQQRLVVLLAEPQRRRMTYEEFLAWADEDTLAEWVDGEIVMTSPASRQHQAIGSFLEKVMGIYVEHQDLGMVLRAPFQMRLAHSGREPDLIFVATANLHRLQATHLDGPADLVVEIVSPESVGRDRGDKFYEYETGGVREYWLLDPDRRWAEFYRLGEDPLYQVAFSGREGVYRSEALSGFWLRVEWLWQPPLILDVLRELRLL